jgi:RHS repeat-associated protein
MTAQQFYDYPLTAGAAHSSAPTYTTETHTWDGMDTGAVTLTYEVNVNGDPRTTTVTLPDNTKRVQKAYNVDAHVGDPIPEFKDKLVYEDVLLDAQGRLIQKSVIDWEEGHLGTARPHRTEDTSYTPDGRSLTLAKEYVYGPYNAVTELKEFDYNNQLARRTVTEYKNRDNGDGRYSYLINLVTSVAAYAPDGTRLALSEYTYDEYTETPLLVTNAPHRELSPYEHPRGNATTIKRYADANANPASGLLVEKRAYDDTGNLISVTTAGGEKIRLNFNADTGFAYASSLSRGLTDDATKRVTVSTSYDYNTGLQLSTTDANGRKTEATYHASTWRPKKTTNAAGAYTSYNFDDSALSFSESTFLADGTVAGEVVHHLNGRGRVRRSESRHAGTIWNVVEAKYDKLGRIWKQSVPFRSDTSASLWTENEYDDRGRLIKVTGPDGSVNETVFDEASRPQGASAQPGPTTKVIDAWGRERWGRVDYGGRLVEVVEPDPEGDGSVAAGGFVTTYSFDCVGNLLEVAQGVQRRTFKYDSLSRLTHQKIAEATATLDAQGTRVGTPAGLWSDVFTYDSRSNMTSRTDARGVKTTYSFADANGVADPLNRLLSVSHNTQGAAGVLPAATVEYAYVPTGDVTRLQKITTVGVSVEEFDYDTEGRVKEKKLTVLSRPGYPFVTNHIYDSLNRTTDTYYPAQYGFGQAPRKVVHNDYDTTSRLSALKVDGANYASQFVYNASSQATYSKIGPAGQNQITEQNTYDPTTGLISEQKVFRGAETDANRLLHLSYDYLRPNTTAGRTGQLTKITNHLNEQRGRTYTYDALGRLKKATGGNPVAAPAWTQTYTYDRYGNRKTVSVTGGSALFEMFEGAPGGALPKDQLAYNFAPQPFGHPLGAASDNRELSDSPDLSLLRLAFSGLFASFLDAPSNVTVNASASTQISLGWTAPAGSVSYYKVERSESVGGPYTFLANSSTSSFTDTTVVPGRAYLYRVRSVSAGGAQSSYSNVALGAAVSFTDDSIVAGVTTIKSQHFNELRQAVNAVRRVAGLGDATWAEPNLSGALVRATHVQEMRDRLNEALAALDIPASPFVDPTLATGASGTLVKKVHVDELRLRASRGRSNSTGGGDPNQVPPDGIENLAYEEASNRITTTGYEYDDAGNQTRLLGPNNTWLRLQYDAAGRLVKVKTDGEATIATYTYSYSRRRIVTQHGSESSNIRTYYAWGTDEVIAEFDENDSRPSQPAWSKNYVYLSTTLLATQTPGAGTETVEFHHPDRLGTRLVTNAAAGTWFEQVTLPYGTALAAESGGATNRPFASYDRSADTRLDYALNRTYNSAQGRFAQADPIGMEASQPLNPQSLNLYAYCGNDPVNRTDPNGLDGISFFFSPFPGFGFGWGTGPRTGWFWNGGLTGLFNFGLGILSWLFSRPNIPGFFRPPFIINTPQPAPVPPPPPPPPVTTVATYGVYNTENYSENDNQAFKSRARKSAGDNVVEFRNGRDLLEGLAMMSSRVGTINNLYVYGHAHPPGIIGSNSQSEGLYIEHSGNYWAYHAQYNLSNGDGTTSLRNYNYSDYFSSEGRTRNSEARTANDFAQAVIRGDINIANNGEIIFFGCNTHALASHVQWILKDNGRPDIRVTGVIGNVSLANSNYGQAGSRGWETFTGRDNNKTVRRGGRRPYR